MSRNDLGSGNVASKFLESSYWQPLTRSMWSKIGQSRYVPQRLCANMKGFPSRFLEIARDPPRFALVLNDLGLLVLSIWRGKQLGPDVVYPMLRIRKRQSGHLAKLILEYAKTRRHHERYAADMAFPQGIDPPCVATINFGDGCSHPVARSRYNTRVDLYGLIFMLIFCNTFLALWLKLIVYFMQGLFPLRRFQLPRNLWAILFTFNLLLCIYAIFQGEGTLALVLRSNTSIPGCAVLLDQDFTVVLNGNHIVLEAIAESSFSLSYPDHAWTRVRVQRDEEWLRDSADDTVELTGIDMVCIAFCVVLWMTPLSSPLQVATTFVNVSRILITPPHPSTLSVVKVVLFQTYLTLCMLLNSTLEDLAETIQLLVVYNSWPALSFSALFSTSYRPRDYPISSAKLLDALGRPSVQKWQFDTFAAAATFQCLVICHRIPRPVDHIDVFAFLDMLVPDQRDVWKAWKERVADRIAHETDVSFAPTIATFGDERQVQLRGLLREAQSGYDVYRAFYDSDRPDRTLTLQ